MGVFGDLVSDGTKAVRELEEAWAACKKLGVDIRDVVDAVEAGDELPDILDVLQSAVNLPGGQLGHQLALRYARQMRNRGPRATRDDRSGPAA